jgi:hypothetical protein
MLHFGLPMQENERVEDDWELFHEAQDSADDFVSDTPVNAKAMSGDHRCFTDMIPIVAPPGSLTLRRIFTVTPLGIEFHQLGPVPVLEYFAWDALRRLEDLMRANPLQLDIALPPRRFRMFLLRARSHFARFMSSMARSIAEYIEYERLVFDEALLEQHKRRGSVGGADMELTRRRVRAASRVKPEPAAVDTLPSREMLDALRATDATLRSQNLCVILVRTEMRHQGSMVVDFALDISKSASSTETVLRRMHYDFEGNLDSSEEYTREMIDELVN